MLAGKIKWQMVQYLPSDGCFTDDGWKGIMENPKSGDGGYTVVESFRRMVYIYPTHDGYCGNPVDILLKFVRYLRPVIEF